MSAASSASLSARHPRAAMLLVMGAVFFTFLFSLLLFGHSLAAEPPTRAPGLQRPTLVLRDGNGIPHIFATNEHDLFFLQGWVHAQDRFFQMDVARREASGTLAELLGPALLAEDVEIRTVGVRRAAERSLPLLSEPVQDALTAYSKGVNAFIQSHPLPPEYARLELSRLDPWSPVDSLAIIKAEAFGLSFDDDDIERTLTLQEYQAAGAIGGFDGTKLFFEDLFRSAPFDPASTIPDASQSSAPTGVGPESMSQMQRAIQQIRSDTLALGRAYLERIRDMRLFRRKGKESKGSNEWAVGGQHTVTGVPLLANDPHLSLDTPATFYQNHLHADDLDVVGASFAGVPFVVLGHNRHIAWGATTNPMDVTDTFREEVRPDPSSPSGLSTVHLVKLEPVIPIPEVFRQNIIGDATPDNLTVVPPGTGIPPVTLIVPRRNHGPIVNLDAAAGTALSVQFTGFSGTRELDAFAIWNRARNLDDFKRGLQFFDFGSQNWAYADTESNIAYFTSGELPLREDLQAGTVNGLPPFFIRNGTGGNEWLPVGNPQPGQAIPFEILPFEEMPQIVNPPAGFFVNANNDPVGTSLDNNPLNQLRPGGGIFYLNPGYNEGMRAGRITQMIRERLERGGRLSFEDMKAMQADTVMLDAQVFVPRILTAFKNATTGGVHPILAAFAADPRVVRAVGRVQAWDFSTPTGIAEGFDATDVDGKLLPPSQTEIDASIAATIYSVWRGQVIRNTIDAVLAELAQKLGSPLPRPGSREAMIALRHLLDNYESNQGIGASGLNFFNVPGVADPATRRDILILKSLADALDLLAGDAFKAAFNNSSNQDDYRWGRLHRIVFEHPLNGPFNIPPAGGAFPPPLSDLPGIPTDGGFQTVDAANHSARADDSADFTFDSGPVSRFVSEMAPHRVRAESSLPGGESGVLGSPFYANLLGAWLTNDTFPLQVSGRSSVEIFLPGDSSTEHIDLR